LAHKILVIDDEQYVRSLLADFFTPLGYRVITTADGNEALELAAREEPDVILLDVVMPGLDGTEVCKALRASDKTALIPVIMMTGFAGAVIDVSQSAPDDLVLKPFMLSDLLKRVRAIIPIRQVTNRLERMLAYLDELDKNHFG
jgi:two-component system phosphate regulon response regulator PhoB